MMKMRLVNVRSLTSFVRFQRFFTSRSRHWADKKQLHLKCIGKIEKTALLTHPKSSFHDHNSFADVNKKIDNFWAPRFVSYFWKILIGSSRIGTAHSLVDKLSLCKRTPERTRNFFCFRFRFRKISYIINKRHPLK